MTGSLAMPIRVLTVDDHPILREGIAAVLGGQPDMVIAGEASSGVEAISRYRELQPDVTLMDLQMPGMNGVEAIHAIRREFPEARIIVLTMDTGDFPARQAIEAGAAGYLLKSMLRKDLLDAIRAVHSGRRRIPAEVATSLARFQADEPLTARETAVLRLVAAGCSNKAAGDRLGITEETVKSHMRHIMGKLGASDRTHAVTIAMKRGMIGQ